MKLYYELTFMTTCILSFLSQSRKPLDGIRMDPKQGGEATGPMLIRMRPSSLTGIDTHITSRARANQLEFVSAPRSASELLCWLCAFVLESLSQLLIHKLCVCVLALLQCIRSGLDFGRRE